MLVVMEVCFLSLTFCQNVLLVLLACSAAARPLVLCISTFLRHCRSENLKIFSQLSCPEVATSQRIHLCEKAKELPISLDKVPTLHQIAVGRNLELRWRYKGRPML